MLKLNLALGWLEGYGERAMLYCSFVCFEPCCGGRSACNGPGGMYDICWASAMLRRRVADHDR